MISSKDKPFMTKEFKDKYRKSAASLLKKNLTNMKAENPGRVHSLLKSMGADPGDCEEVNTFTLTSHLKLLKLLKRGSLFSLLSITEKP